MVQRPVALVNIQFYELFWVKLFNQGEPGNWVVRELPGLILMFGYFVILPVVLAGTIFKKMYKQMGMSRYVTMMVMFTWLAMVPIKMVLRWVLDFKYFVNIREYFFNI